MGNEEAGGPEGAGKPGRVGPGREAVHEREEDGWVGWDFLPEVARRGREKGRRRGAEEGLRNTGDPGDVEERPWVEEVARSSERRALRSKQLKLCGYFEASRVG